MSLTGPIDPAVEQQEQIWDHQGRWWVGHFNRSSAATVGLLVPEQVTLIDATLREGEEVPGTFLTLEEKLSYARYVAELGVREMEVGYAGVIDEHYELIRRLKAEGIPVKLGSHTRIYGQANEWRAEIDRNMEAGADSLTLVGWASEAGMAGTPWMTKQDVPERVRDCVQYAKQQGAHVTFGLADLVRTRLDYVWSCYGAAAEAGVDRVYVYDGQGAAAPHAVAYLTRLLRDVVGPQPEIAFHGHDSLGLATANALAALTNGASAVDTVPNGLGDGAGITATEEIVMALEVFHGVPTGIRLESLKELSEKVGDLLGYTLPQTKAVVGKNMFRHQIDSHVAAILRGTWHSWEVIRPDVVGQQRRLEFGYAKLRRGRSGALFAKAQKMGLEVSDDQLITILERVREVAAAKRFATEEEVARIIQEVTHS